MDNFESDSGVNLNETNTNIAPLPENLQPTPQHWFKRHLYRNIIAIIVIIMIAIFIALNIFVFPAKAWEKAMQSENKNVTNSTLTYSENDDEIAVLTIQSDNDAELIFKTTKFPDIPPLSNELDKGFTIKKSPSLRKIFTDPTEANYQLEGVEINDGKLSYKFAWNPSPEDIEKLTKEYITHSFSSLENDSFSKAIRDFGNSTASHIKFVEANIWIDVWNREMIKFSAELETPAFVNNLSTQIEQSNTQARQTIKDMKQLENALIKYHDYHKVYPFGSKELSPQFISSIPTAPPPQGACTNNDSNYIYNAVGYPTSGGAPNFVYYFCVSTSVDGYDAGNYVLTPNGIEKSNIPSAYGINAVNTPIPFRSPYDIALDRLQTLFSGIIEAPQKGSLLITITNSSDNSKNNSGSHPTLAKLLSNWIKDKVSGYSKTPATYKTETKFTTAENTAITLRVEPINYNEQQKSWNYKIHYDITPKAGTGVVNLSNAGSITLNGKVLQNNITESWAFTTDYIFAPSQSFTLIFHDGINGEGNKVAENTFTSLPKPGNNISITIPAANQIQKQGDTLNEIEWKGIDINQANIYLTDVNGNKIGYIHSRQNTYDTTTTYVRNALYWPAQTVSSDGAFANADTPISPGKYKILIEGSNGETASSAIFFIE